MRAAFRRQVRRLLPSVSPGGAVAAAPVVPPREIFRRFWPYVRPFRPWLALALVFVVAGPAVEAATIWLFKRLIDDVLVPRDLGALLPIAAAYAVLTLAS